MNENPPNICTSLTPLSEKLRAHAQEYSETLNLFEQEGTKELAGKLKALQAEILAIQGEINELIAPLGMHLEKEVRLRDTPADIEKLLRECGSPATLDASFGEGGIVSVAFDPTKIKDQASARKALEEADGVSSHYIGDEWEKVPFKTPERSSFDILVFSYDADPGTRGSSQKIVDDMDRLGFRPLTLEEMMIAGIQEPKFTKTDDKYFVGLTKYTLDGHACVPFLCRDDGVRIFGWLRWGDGWDVGNRFLCVRK